jgi:uroporphyrinogen decarboxylase
MPLTERENFIRNTRRTGPDRMPCRLMVSLASWDQWREAMEEVVLRHPAVCPGYRKGQFDFDNLPFGPAHRKGEDFRDAWGCVWRSAVNGLEGVVVEHPIEDWAALERWEPPDPLVTGDRGPVDWEGRARSIADAKDAGKLTTGSVAHGFFLLRLTYLRGFENLMLDLATEPPGLHRLIEMVDRHNKLIVDQYLGLGVDHFHMGEDLGMQSASIVSPAMFRKWCVPSYRKLSMPCKAAGMTVSLHSDGYIMDLMDAFAECGIDTVNPQDLVNGIDNLKRECKGRFCIRLDVDRQKIVPFGTRREIEELIEESVRKLGSPQGGLELICGVYPPTSPENVDAVCCAMERFRTWWFDGRPRKV